MKKIEDAVLSYMREWMYLRADNIGLLMYDLKRRGIIITPFDVDGKVEKALNSLIRKRKIRFHIRKSTVLYFRLNPSSIKPSKSSPSTRQIHGRT